jgi:lipopolysaccharide transport system permease protein
LSNKRNTETAAGNSSSRFRRPESSEEATAVERESRGHPSLETRAGETRFATILGWIREFWEYRELFYFLVWRDVKIRYKQTVLGAAWAIIQPFFMMIVFTVFFGRMAKMPSDGIPYPLFSYSALLPWIYFSTSLSLSGNSLIGGANLVRKVYFPRIALPAASTFSGLVDFAIAFVILLALMAYYGIAPGWGLLLWPVLLVPLVLLALGMGMILSSLNVKYRDIKYAIPFFVQTLLFITPIIYPTSIAGTRIQFLLHLNPLTGLIEAFRASMLPTKEIDWSLLGLSVGVTLLIFAVGLAYFRKTEREFADVI